MWGWKNVSHLPNILPSINMLFMERSSFDTWDVQDFSTHVLCEHSIDVALNRFPLDSLHRFYFRLGYVELSYRNDINFVPVSLIKCCNQHNQVGGEAWPTVSIDSVGHGKAPPTTGSKKIRHNLTKFKKSDKIWQNFKNPTIFAKSDIIVPSKKIRHYPANPSKFETIWQIR